MPVTQPHTASVTGVVQTEAALLSALCNAQTDAGNCATQPRVPYSMTAHARDGGDEMRCGFLMCEEEEKKPSKVITLDLKKSL